MVKAICGGKQVEIWFTPSFNIKTEDKRLEMLFRNAEIEAFDPWRKVIRKVKPTKSEIDTYLFIEEMRVRVPELEIEVKEAPPVPTSADEGAKDNPVLE
jgi:hypothetical protein